MNNFYINHPQQNRYQQNHLQQVSYAGNQYLQANNQQQYSSNNFCEYEGKLNQLKNLEQACLQLCNNWLQRNNVVFRHSRIQLQFNTMQDLEFFLDYTRSRIKQSKYNSLKYGSAFAVVLTTFYFFFNGNKRFNGETIALTYTFSAIGGCLSFYLLFPNSNSDFTSFHETTIDFEQFEQLCQPYIQDIKIIKTKLIDSQSNSQLLGELFIK
ncbi:hypothetical protein ABPG72_002539 [Tetrahymena utriculariae]